MTKKIYIFDTTLRDGEQSPGVHLNVREITGNSNKVDAIENLLMPYGIIELIRTGKIACSRGSKN